MSVSIEWRESKGKREGVMEICVKGFFLDWRESLKIFSIISSLHFIIN